MAQAVLRRVHLEDLWNSFGAHGPLVQHPRFGWPRLRLELHLGPRASTFQIQVSCFAEALRLWLACTVLATGGTKALQTLGGGGGARALGQGQY